MSVSTIPKQSRCLLCGLKWRQFKRYCWACAREAGLVQIAHERAYMERLAAKRQAAKELTAILDAQEQQTTRLRPERVVDGIVYEVIWDGAIR